MKFIPLLRLVAFATLPLAACQPAPEPPAPEAVKPIKIFTVGTSPIAAEKEFYGRAEAAQSADLSFRVSGRLAELSVREGETVEAGQTVARLDKRDQQNRESETQSQLDQARAVLSQLRAGARPEEIRRMEASVSARESEYQEARARFERYDKLFADGMVTRQNFEQSKTAMDAAEANLESARQELAMGKKGARDEELRAQEAVVRGLEARLQEVRDGLSDTDLRAPFAGVVSRVHVNNFEDVQTKQPIVTLQDISAIDVAIHVAEGDFARGQSENRGAAQSGRTVATASFSALPGQAFPLRLKEFQTEADPQTQTYRVVLRMDQPAGNPVKPGMSATVKGSGASGNGDSGIRMIPVNSVFSGTDGTPSVWLVDPETMRIRAVPAETGEIVQDNITVLGGLSPGDRVAASAANLLREGMIVEEMKDPGSL